MKKLKYNKLNGKKLWRKLREESGIVYVCVVCVLGAAILKRIVTDTALDFEVKIINE